MSLAPLTPPPVPKAPKPPGKVGAFFRRLVTWPARLSLAARAAWVLALVLVAVVAAAWIIFLTRPESVPWQFTLTLQRIVMVSVLLALIPLVFYAALQMWLVGEPSPFPDIDYAWKAGLDALRQHGLDVQRVPLFLVLGADSEAQERALMDASKQSLRVRGVPEGPAPLHWYANPDRIYLFCSDAGWLGALSALMNRTLSQRPAADRESPRWDIPAETLSDPEPSPVAPPSRGTMSLSQLTRPPAEETARGEAAETPAGASRGTMMFQAPLAGTLAAEPRPQAALVEERRAVLPARDSADQLERLRYACRLLRAAREPFCPINGLLTLLSLDLLQGTAAEVAELERAVRSDLAVVHRTLQLRCPVTALVVGMEQEEGFRELVRRVGRQRAAQQRFGQRFDVRSPASPDELSALAVHVCGAFEDWIYTLFQEQGALTRPGNRRLYMLLCTVRSRLQSRLSEVLAEGFGSDARQPSSDEGLFFSGCYFAATGETEDKQAFVKAVLDKTEDEQEEVQWSRDAVRADRRCARWASAGFALAGLLALGLIGAVVVRVMQP